MHAMPHSERVGIAVLLTRGVTCRENGVLVLAVYPVALSYTAVSDRAPRGRSLVVHCAAPATTGTALQPAMGVPPSRKVTVPAADGVLTVAVRVTLAPIPTVLLELVSERVVATLPSA